MILLTVPSENKRDLRTIEAVQADLQAKKKMKLSQASSSTNETQDNWELTNHEHNEHVSSL